MKPKARFIKSVIAAAEQNEMQMPWARGNRRAAMIALRSGRKLEAVKKSA